jgi:predicted nuclease of predicted toxin-antitoxin system
VRFLIDAQLPRRLVAVLHQRGHDAVHTLDLPEGNRTPDDRLCDLCGSDERVLISKDRDFVDSHLHAEGRQAGRATQTAGIRNAVG